MRLRYGDSVSAAQYRQEYWGNSTESSDNSGSSWGDNVLPSPSRRQASHPGTTGSRHPMGYDSHKMNNRQQEDIGMYNMNSLYSPDGMYKLC